VIEGRRVAVSIDEGLCQGHAICHLLFPDLFEVDDEGRSTVVRPVLGPESEEQARTAAQRCPERAIGVVQA